MIDTIYLPNHFFTHITKNVLNFRYNQLQNDVHLSLSYGKKNARYNFHVSRNIGPSSTKPQIIVFKIEKALAHNILNQLGRELFNIYYRPLPISYHQGLSKRRFAKRVRFLPAELPDSVEDSLKKVVTGASVEYGSRLDFDPSVLDKFSAWANNRVMQKNLATTVERLPWNFAEKPRFGYLISPRYNGLVLLHAGQYFIRKEKFNLLTVATEYLGVELMKKLTFKTLLAIRRISEAKSNADTNKYYDPILFG